MKGALRGSARTAAPRLTVRGLCWGATKAEAAAKESATKSARSCMVREVVWLKEPKGVYGLSWRRPPEGPMVADLVSLMSVKGFG